VASTQKWCLGSPVTPAGVANEVLSLKTILAGMRPLTRLKRQSALLRGLHRR
jgi:hypothetical protein